METHSLKNRWASWPMAKGNGNLSTRKCGKSSSSSWTYYEVFFILNFDWNCSSSEKSFPPCTLQWRSCWRWSTMTPTPSASTWYRSSSSCNLCIIFILIRLLWSCQRAQQMNSDLEMQRCRFQLLSSWPCWCWCILTQLSIQGRTADSSRSSNEFGQKDEHTLAQVFHQDQISTITDHHFSIIYIIIKPILSYLAAWWSLRNAAISTASRIFRFVKVLF